MATGYTKPAWLQDAEVAEMNSLMSAIHSEMQVFSKAQVALSKSVQRKPASVAASKPKTPCNPTRPAVAILNAGDVEYTSHVSGRSVKRISTKQPTAPTGHVRLPPVHEEAAARVRRLSVSQYVGTRRLSVHRQPNVPSGAMLDDGSHVSTASQSALDKPDFVGTVTVGVGVAGVVSDAARACGSVLGTAVRDDDAFIQVRVQGASYDTFIATLDAVTGKDYCLSRTDVSGVPVPATTTSELGTVCVRPARRRSHNAAGLLATSSCAPSLTTPDKPQAMDVGANRHIARQVREALRAKAGLLLLRAAETGAVFMLPKLLDAGLPMPRLDVLSVSLGSILTDDVSQLEAHATCRDTERVRAPVDVTDDEGRTPLMIAAYLGHAVFVEKLLLRGASLTKHNWAGETAFECARKGLTHAKEACTRQIEGAKVWKAGCSSIMRALDCRSVVQCAFERDARRLQHLIEDLGHDPNEQNVHGMTALHFGVMKQSPQIVKFLMKWGADPTIPNTIGQSALSLAKDMGALGLVHMMQRDSRPL